MLGLNWEIGLYCFLTYLVKDLAMFCLSLCCILARPFEPFWSLLLPSCHAISTLHAPPLHEADPTEMRPMPAAMCRRLSSAGVVCQVWDGNDLL